MCNNNSINSDEKSSVLIDKTKSGKIRPWREKKMANVDYFELLHILEFKKAERVKDCAEVLEYKVSYETGEKTLRSEERRVGKERRSRKMTRVQTCSIPILALIQMKNKVY